MIDVALALRKSQQRPSRSTRSLAKARRLGHRHDEKRASPLGRQRPPYRFLAVAAALEDPRAARYRGRTTTTTHPEATMATTQEHEGVQISAVVPTLTVDDLQ